MSSYDGHLSNLNSAWQDNTDASVCEVEYQASLSSFHSDIGFLSIFKKSQESSPYEAFNSVCLSRGHRDMRHPVQMTLTPTAFSRFSTGDSDIRSSCEMKDEPSFNPLQGNPTFFRVRAFRGPFHLQQQTQGPSHIPIAEGRLLLRYLFKVGLTVQ